MHCCTNRCLKKGWGAALGNDETGGRWTSAEATNHINILELQAAFFALKAFCNNTHHTHVQLQIDNTTAVAYINNMGGSQSPLLNTLAKEIWNWCIERDIWVSAVHIAGKLNTSADNKSLNFSDKHEWSLSRVYFLEIFSTFPELNIDLFASRLNNQLDTYCSWKPDPGCTHVDAFSINWSNFNFFAFPPFSLIPKCVQKIIQDKAKGILLIMCGQHRLGFHLSSNYCTAKLGFSSHHQTCYIVLRSRSHIHYTRPCI